MQAIFLGVDIGTSGIRASCINVDAKELLHTQIDFSHHQTTKQQTQQNPDDWLTLFDKLLAQTTVKLKQLSAHYQIQTIAIDGTSSTVIACTKKGKALAPALMYHNQQSTKQAQLISQFAPAQSAVHGASSTLAKALFLLERYPETEFFCHQSDWLVTALTGKMGVSDENNCLKFGFDSIKQQWPSWVFNCVNHVQLKPSQLPKVVAPATLISKVKPTLIKKYQLGKNCFVAAGTTDSNAAVLASGAQAVGDGISSLGSTLVIKIFAKKPIFNAKYGIYSHRINNKWLVGGASNSGGSALLKHFNAQQMLQMTPQLNPSKKTGFNYYPLPDVGERFPIYDLNKKNQTLPQAKNEVVFFQALLEGIAQIETLAYTRLHELGAPLINTLYSSGGGAKNSAWTKIRQQNLAQLNPKIKLAPATNHAACYGSALLARQAFFQNTTNNKVL